MVTKAIVLIETLTTPVVAAESIARKELLAVVAPLVSFCIQRTLFGKVLQGVV